MAMKKEIRPLYEKVPPLENNFSIKFREYRCLGWMPHWHEHLELFFLVRGSGTLFLDGRPIPMKEGDLAVIRGTEIHSYTTEDRAHTHDTVLIYPAFLADIDFSPNSLEGIVRGDPEVAAIFSALHAEYRKGGADGEMMQKSHVYRLLSYLLRAHPAADPRAERGRRLMLSRFSSVVRYVDENYTEPITTAELAEMCYLSEGHFCRFFKSATGKTPLEYVNEYRIEKAATLLVGTDATVTEIALSVGFSDVNYFSRMFRRIKGIAPGAYRAAADA